VRLSKIKLAGFKSFVDPTTIVLPSNLVGVVGPNGCGKSNVIDAIRWVMGETSAKNLRGDNMTDVIFNGSSQRKPVGAASIELFFDNSDGTITGQFAGYNEISIRRTVSRDGTSQYFLNNVRCRRKDIVGIFLGTGLGPRSYSIIEQGMISRLIEAKPEDLRAHLEEAAGISKYKERRRETENRIRHTRDNLDRLNDLREEVEKQIVHLQRQAKQAERHKALKLEQHQLDAEWLAIRLREHDASLQVTKSEYEQYQTGYEAAVASQRRVEAETETAREKQHEVSEALNEVQAAHYKVDLQISQLQQGIEHNKSTTERQQQDLTETHEQLNKITHEIEVDEQQLRTLDARLNEISPDLERIRSAAASSSEELEKSEFELNQWREAWQEVSNGIFETTRTSEVEEARIHHLDEQQQDLSRRRSTLEAELAGLSVDTLENDLADKIRTEADASAKADSLGRKLHDVVGMINNLREQEKVVTTELEQSRNDLEAHRARLMTLEALQKAALGQDKEAVEGWLQNHALGDRPRLGQQISVETPWEKAAETVLSSMLQAVDVGDFEQHLNAGLPAANLVLLGAAAPLSDDAYTDRPTLFSKVSNAGSVAGLLKQVRLADSLAEALRLRHTLSETESAITPDGIWVSRCWVRINRAEDETGGVITREQEIRTLQTEIAAREATVARNEQRRIETNQQLEQQEKLRSELQIEHNRSVQAAAQASAALAAFRQEVAKTRSRQSALMEEMQGAKRQFESVGALIRESQSRLAQAKKLGAGHETRRNTLREQQEPLTSAVQAARSAAEVERQRLQELTIELETRRSSRESASTTLERAQVARTQLAQRIESLKTSIEKNVEPLAALQTKLQAQLQRKLEVDQELKLRHQRLDAANSLLNELDRQRSSCDKSVNEAREQVDSRRMRVREIEVRREGIAEQFAELKLVLEDVLAELPEEATTEVWEQKVEKVAQSIERLGNVNLLAIEEYDEQSERKIYLDAQFEDLTSALETLENAIQKIDRETRTRFQETFDNVNAGIQRIFPRLFGGGHAYLTLEGDDVLSAGVSVMAQPPGKRNSSIHLLSGGEKALTAVSLVFAIFELNPAPFCLLDEVDAPLDDANVGRFCDIVREMSEHVQFLFITHNKLTMELAGQLMGVTMYEPGVSRLVSVDIDEAVKLAAS
jgi:chromosome segregation protein